MESDGQTVLNFAGTGTTIFFDGLFLRSNVKKWEHYKIFEWIVSGVSTINSYFWGDLHHRGTVLTNECQQQCWEQTKKALSG